jgi:hypothetical protein
MPSIEHRRFTSFDQSIVTLDRVNVKSHPLFPITDEGFDVKRMQATRPSPGIDFGFDRSDRQVRQADPFSPTDNRQRITFQSATPQILIRRRFIPMDSSVGRWLSACRWGGNRSPRVDRSAPESTPKSTGKCWQGKTSTSVFGRGDPKTHLAPLTHGRIWPRFRKLPSH